MTENENIKKILYMGVGRSGLENESSIIAKALSELMEYRAIGTVEEFKALKEKASPKKPITYADTNRADCPICKSTVRGISRPFGDYCSHCGQLIDWQ